MQKPLLKHTTFFTIYSGEKISFHSFFLIIKLQCLNHNVVVRLICNSISSYIHDQISSFGYSAKKPYDLRNKISTKKCTRSKHLKKKTEL